MSMSRPDTVEQVIQPPNDDAVQPDELDDEISAEEGGEEEREGEEGEREEGEGEEGEGDAPPEIPEHLKQFRQKVDPEGRYQELDDPQRLEQAYERFLDESLYLHREARGSRAREPQEQAPQTANQAPPSPGEVLHKSLQAKQAQLNALVQAGQMDEEQAFVELQNHRFEVEEQIRSERQYRQQSYEQQMAQNIDSALSSHPEYQPFRDTIYGLVFQGGWHPEQAFQHVYQLATTALSSYGAKENTNPPKPRPGRSSNFIESPTTGQVSGGNSKTKQKEQTQKALGFMRII